MNRPNLFSYATSDLSQDAFLCWLLEWGDPQHQPADMALHNAGTQFITDIFSKHQLHAPAIHSIQITRQAADLDILATINDEFAILIVGKSITADQTNQLMKVRNNIEKKGCLHQLPIYYQTGNQGSYRGIEKAGFQHFSRQDMLTLMGKGIMNGIEDSIFTAYYEHLLKIEAAHNSYVTSQITDWRALAWQGFYSELQARGLQGDWSYFANTQGGFTGFWWHWKSDEESNQYLQLEEDKLCFKIKVEEKSRRRMLRAQWHKAMVEKGNELGLAFRRPDRFGSGNFMTVAVLDDYRVADEQGLIDLEATIEGLRKAEEALDSITQGKDRSLFTHMKTPAT
ncbi:PD-(D/E)XK nuclease family protein [Bacillus sp. AK031]